MVFPEAKHAPVPFLGATQEPSYRVCYPRERVTHASHSRTLVEVVFPSTEAKQRAEATLTTPTEHTAAYFIQAALHQSGLAVPIHSTFQARTDLDTEHGLFPADAGN